MLAEADRLAAELGASQKRSGLVAHFLAQYQLAPAEVAALQVRAAFPPPSPWPPSAPGSVSQRCALAHTAHPFSDWTPHPNALGSAALLPHIPV